MKRIGVVVLGLVLACGLGSRTEEPAEKDAVRCEMKLKNGSLIKGTIKGLDKVTLKTKYGELKVPVKDLRSMTWGEIKKEELDTLVARDATYKGWIQDMEPFQVDTGFGVLNVPTTAIKNLRVRKDGDTLGDDFEAGDLEDWKTFGTSTWTVTDGVLQGTPSGNYDSIQFAEELEGAYTLEVELKGSNNAGILWHAKDGNDATALWVSQGNARVFSGGTWYNNQIAYWNTPVQQNANVRLKIEVDGEQATIYVNDQKMGEVRTASKSGRIGLFCFNQATQFDNVVITR